MGPNHTHVLLFFTLTTTRHVHYFSGEKSSFFTCFLKTQLNVSYNNRNRLAIINTLVQFPQNYHLLKLHESHIFNQTAFISQLRVNSVVYGRGRIHTAITPAYTMKNIVRGLVSLLIFMFVHTSYC